MPNLLPLTLNDARHYSGLDLVSAEDVCERVSGRTYADMENESESPTHARLRELAIQMFTAYGYRVFSSGIGVRDVYAMADFLAIRDQRVVFVEVLTDAKATPTDLQQKKVLAAHGELVFVFIGHIKNRDPAALEVQRQAALAHDVLLGCWGWGSCNGLAPEHPFQRFAFALTPDQSVTIGAEVVIVGKRINLTFSLVTAPYPISRSGLVSPEPTTAAAPAFAQGVADTMAGTLRAKWSKPRCGHSILKDTTTGKRLAKRLVPGSRRRFHMDHFEPLCMELEPPSAAVAIDAVRKVAVKNRLELIWSGATQEAVSDFTASYRSRSGKAVASADVAALLQALRAMEDVTVYRLDLLRALGWSANRGNRVIRQLVADGALWCSTQRNGQIICGLQERQRSRINE